jgi:hypothetical protein
MRLDAKKRIRNQIRNMTFEEDALFATNKQLPTAQIVLLTFTPLTPILLLFAASILTLIVEIA